METENERYERYLKQNKGVWFASNPEMEKWAERKVTEGSLKPLSHLISNTKATKYWYVKSTISKVEQLLEYFSANGLYELFGVYDFCLDFQI